MFGARAGNAKGKATTLQSTFSMLLKKTYGVHTHTLISTKPAKFDMEKLFSLLMPLRKTVSIDEYVVTYPVTWTNLIQNTNTPKNTNEVTIHPPFCRSLCSSTAG